MMKVVDSSVVIVFHSALAGGCDLIGQDFIRSLGPLGDWPVFCEEWGAAWMQRGAR